MPFIAFFDVDETLINDKSMFSFLRFYFKKTSPVIGGFYYYMTIKLFKLLSLFGVERRVINMLYYHIYRDVNYSLLLSYGKEWFDEQVLKIDFFIPSSISRLQLLKSQGATVVLVSGSFKACLQPLSECLGVSDILCAELEVVNDKVTGRLTQQAIGAHKSSLARNRMMESKVLPEHCYAFGDHISDLELLRSVGNPVVVKNCPDLFSKALENN